MPIIRQTMRNVILKEKDWKMVVVAPNTHFHFPIAMVRVIVPGAMSEDKVFIPLEGIFKEFPADKFEFVLGAAEGLDPKGKVVSVSLNNGGAKREIGYDALIIATGAAARDDGEDSREAP
ncbi:unnamed protein product [Fusarium equiseti]|uniref:FAD/NAD(P)-binding domain-containing protein n=1 Tax=Fusarium equiseti TaxID=61235 RepID=A0A8J2ICI8_FUSEQ|nr:unnamed protein product [Fusarium equiseti]